MAGHGPSSHRHDALPEVAEGMRSRFLDEPDPAGWTEPVFSQWELTATGWEDCHPHSETNIVIEGELHVECDGVVVVLRPGDVVRVRAGVPARYWAPVRARMVGIYGPNPDGTPTPPGRSWKVAG